MSDFGEGNWRVGRKDYRCEWCGQGIPKGETHYHYAGMWDNEWQNWRMHEECHEDADRSDAAIDGFTPFDNERPKKLEAACQEK